MLAFYGDLDRMGLILPLIFIKIRPLALIVPSIWQEITVTHIDNNVNKFLKQIVQTRDIAFDQAEPLILRGLFHHVKTNQIAIMQEKCKSNRTFDGLALIQRLLMGNTEDFKWFSTFFIIPK